MTKESTWEETMLGKSCLLLAGYAYKYYRDLINCEDFEEGDYGQWELLQEVIETHLPNNISPRVGTIRLEISTHINEIVETFKECYDYFKVDLREDLSTIDEFVDDDYVDDARDEIEVVGKFLHEKAIVINGLLLELIDALRERPAPVPCAHKADSALAPMVIHEAKPRLEKLANATKTLNLLALKMLARQTKGE